MIVIFGRRILILIHLEEKSRIPDPTTTKKE
jgi:hypothetical protein